MNKRAVRTTTRKTQNTRKGKLNVRLLRRIQKHILEEPRRLTMGAVCVKRGEEGTWRNTFYGDAGPQSFAKCGTAACIAGWALALEKRPLLRGHEGMSIASELLGFGQRRLGAFNKCDALFFTSRWPDQFNGAYYKAKSNRARAEVASARIEYFIKTGE